MDAFIQSTRITAVGETSACRVVVIFLQTLCQL